MKANELVSVNGKTVLVVGCSTGLDCKLFVEDYGALKVDGVDLSSNIGEDFKHERVSYYRTSAEDMVEIPDDFYDLVYCLATLEHVANIKRALTEMVRVTKPLGYIYSFSGPLWNSSQGHHKSNFFKDYPWIHLRLNQDQIIDYCHKNGIKDDDQGISMEYHIQYMLDSKYFNKLPSVDYVDVCDNLSDIIILKNNLVFDPDSLLTDRILLELSTRGLTRGELLAKCHIFIAIKKQQQNILKDFKTWLGSRFYNFRNFFSKE